MEKRLIIAIAMSLLIMLGFQYINASKRRRIQPASVSTPVAAVQERADMPLPREEVQVREKEQPAEKEGMAFPETETVIRTEKYELVFSDKGGSLKRLSLKEYQEEGKDEILLDTADPAQRPFAMRSPFLPGLEKEKFVLTEGEGFLEYSFTKPGWIEIRKRYDFHKSLNQIGLGVSIKNLSPNNINFSYRLIGPSSLKKSEHMAGRRFLQADTMIDGKIWKVKSVKRAQEKSGQIAWVGLKNRYFTLVLKPFSVPRSVTVESTPGKDLMVALNSKQYELAPGRQIEEQYLFYAGPLSEQKLEAIGYDMQGIVDYGFFGGISKILLSVLRFFHKGTHNWGLAIILLTIMINIVLFPLTVKSFSSMHKMKTVQPHMQKLKELHKDNPQKLNKEMMELYKKYNVNPLGGCLPMILQMPIFISLYQGLMRSIELKGSNFLWIKDLSRPDAVPLPFSLPFIGSSVNILPLLMVGMMVLQQKISQGISAGAMTNEQASQQKMMMTLFPLFFGFLFYKMPSGLVLYWLTNTILMTAEQGFISKRMSES
ncbi:MAG: membrane protein insertase YidC [Candidatus Omnitrophota bacterium]|nr:membrane protein insertase YidC [Candidatus Omnitrophota bacterium]